MFLNWLRVYCHIWKYEFSNRSCIFVLELFHVWNWESIKVVSAWIKRRFHLQSFPFFEFIDLKLLWDLLISRFFSRLMTAYNNKQSINLNISIIFSLEMVYKYSIFLYNGIIHCWWQVCMGVQSVSTTSNEGQYGPL